MTQLSSYSSFTADSSLSAAKILVSNAPDTLTETAKLLYRALVATAIETARRRGYSPNVTHVTLHLPLEQLAKACGIHRRTVWKHLPALRELGVLDYRTHKGNCRGEVRNTGTLFMIRLDPARGSKAKLSFGDMKHKWRDLDKDVKAGRTSYRDLQRESHTEESTSLGFDLDKLLFWTLPPQHSESPLQHVCDSLRRIDLETLLDVKTAPKEERNVMVKLAAEALATALADANSVNWYQKLLWQLLRRFDSTGDDYSYQIYLAAQRAAIDRSEGFARRSGALFHSRLKKADWFEWVMNAPPNRVGAKPV